MNAVLSLSHFCEIHGPSVLFSTQAFHFAGEIHSGVLEPSGIQFFGCLKKLRDYNESSPPNVNNVACEACESISGYITNDYQNKISFLSTRLPIDSNVSSLLKQAAVRSLSCEVVPGKEGQVYFGDTVRGHVLSSTFFLKDAQARGFHRWYSILVFMKDKHFLLNSWHFFQQHINQIFVYLQKQAAEVYTNEERACSQRGLRLSSLDRKHSSARSLVKLTASTDVFAQLHSWFTWLLSTGAKRLEEHLLTRTVGSQALETQGNSFNLIQLEICMRPDWNRLQLSDSVGSLGYESIEERTVLGKNIGSTGRFVFNNETNRTKTEPKEEHVHHLRQLRQTFGAYNFQRVLYSTLIGRQIVVRGPEVIVENIINLLKLFLPVRKIRCQDFGGAYSTPEKCNIVGLDLSAAVPKSSENIMRLDIVPFQEIGKTTLNNTNLIYKFHNFIIKNERTLPEKLPSLLLKVDKALSDESLTNRVVALHIHSLLRQWFHIAEVIQEARKKQNDSCMMGLMQSLGVQEQDDKLIEFWTS